MTGNPAISVVMSVFNGAIVLAETLESILHQTHDNFEFLVVDDGSTDDSGRILDSYASKDSRVSVFHQEKKGLTQALIFGCSKAKGKYIARQDAGDVSKTDRLEIQHLFMKQNPQLSFVSCWTEIFGPQWEFLCVEKGTGRANSPQHILSVEEKYGAIDGPSHHSSVLFLREAYEEVGGYRKEFYYGQDWDLWYRLAETGLFQMIQKPLQKSRIFPRGISMGNRNLQRRFAKISRESLEFRAQGQPDRMALAAAASIPIPKDDDVSAAPGLYFIGEALRRNGDPRAERYLFESVRDNPWRLKPWLRIMQCKLSAFQQKAQENPTQ